MRKIARLPKRDREALLRNTANKMGVSFAIVEKDFWVSYVLDYLFSRNQWKEHFAFKGGTSLSKAFGLIERFSEDVDLILDWRLLGIIAKEPWANRTRNQQDKFNQNVNNLTSRFLKHEFLPTLLDDFSVDLGEQALCEIDRYDGQTVLFKYPTDQPNVYINPEIRLEIGALAAWSSASWQTITPYAATEYPMFFEQKSTKAFTIEPKRTFWEKATILHQEAHRKADSNVRLRYSRHYYDFYQMCSRGVQEAAFEEIKLLDSVINFKQRFYPCGWANYADASAGHLKLIPSQAHVVELKKDYAQMREMIFGEALDFDSILEKLAAVETEVNTIILHRGA